MNSFTVNKNGDDATTQGTLRWAITQLNNSSNGGTIEFDLSPPNTTIMLESQLPQIKVSDGSTININGNLNDSIVVINAQSYTPIFDFTSSFNASLNINGNNNLQLEGNTSNPNPTGINIQPITILQLTISDTQFNECGITVSFTFDDGMLINSNSFSNGNINISSTSGSSGVSFTFNGNTGTFNSNPNNMILNGLALVINNNQINNVSASVTNCTNSNIEGNTFESQLPTQSANLNLQKRNSNIENTNSERSAFKFMSSNNITFKHNRIDGYKNALELTGSGHTIQDNIIINSSDAAIQIKNGHYNKFINNNLGMDEKGNAAPNKLGIAYDPGANANHDIIKCNNIAYNKGPGILLPDSTVTNIGMSANTIFNNNGKGIALQNGANHGITPPTITRADSFGSIVFVDGYFSNPTFANLAIRIEFFANEKDKGHITEGKVYLGRILTKTDSNGYVAFKNVKLDLTSASGTGHHITSTAMITQEGQFLGDTSEYSPYFHITSLGTVSEIGFAIFKKYCGNFDDPCAGT